MLNLNLGSYLKPEVEIRAFCACAVEKNAKNMLKIAFFELKSDLYRFSGMLNPNLSSFFKPEVEIRAFLRMRSEKRQK